MSSPRQSRSENRRTYRNSAPESTRRSNPQGRRSSGAEDWYDDDYEYVNVSSKASRRKAPTVPSSVRKKKKRNRRPGILAWLISLAALCAGGYFIFELFRLDILPLMYLFIFVAVLSLLLLLFVWIWLGKTRRPVSRTIMAILVIVLGVGCGMGGVYARATEDMFTEISSLTDRKANVISFYTLKGNHITEPDQLKDGTVGYVDGLDSHTQDALESLRKQGASFTPVQYDSIYSLVDALFDHEVTTIAFPENNHEELYEAANDENQYSALNTFANITDEYIYYTDRDASSITPSDPVANIMSDPFTVLISGNDSYGTIDTVSRSDVNMLVTVNPRTAQILMISIPRDTYVTVSCEKNSRACEAVDGSTDKLTHTGIYGVGTTESTIEDFLGVPINYYVRVNFSSLINLVDAVGGVDIDVPEGQEVERFYANGEEGVHAGVNHLDGDRALAFARERHAYVDGDNQRVKNQAMVMKALIRKCMSPSMFINYPKVAKAVSTAIDTNMSARELKSLVTLEIARRPDWNIQNYAIAGESSFEYCATLNTTASASIAVPSMVEYAKSLIADVRAGETIEISPEAITPSVDLTQDQTQTEQDNAYNEPLVTDPYGYGQDYVDPGYDPYQQPAQDYGYTDPNVQYDAWGNPIDPSASPFIGYDEWGNPIYGG